MAFYVSTLRYFFDNIDILKWMLILAILQQSLQPPACEEIQETHPVSYLLADVDIPPDFVAYMTKTSITNINDPLDLDYNINTF